MKALHRLCWHCRVLRAMPLAFFCVASGTTVVAQAAAEHPSDDDWFTSYFVDGYGLLVVFIVAIVALLVFRKLRSGRARKDPLMAKAKPRVQVAAQAAPEPRKPTPVSTAKQTEFKERRATPRESPSSDYSRQAFGAYRIDQEVGKLVLGKAHRMDVLASRVP